MMKKFATITVIGRDKTGVVARVTSFLFEQRAQRVIDERTDIQCFVTLAAHQLFFDVRVDRDV